VAGTEVTDLLLRIRGDTSDAEQAVNRIGGKFTELNQGLELARKAFDVLRAATEGLVQVIDRGQGVSELTASFNALQSAAGSLASNELQQLRQATQGLLSDTELMRAANESLLAGLDPQQFLAVANAADTLGDAVGKNTKEALDDLTRALDTGQTKLLKQYGVLVDTKKAEDDLAKSLGITADKLTEEGKRYADRQAILDKIKQKTDALSQSNDNLGKSNDLAGDSLQKIKAAANNVFDRFAQAINENQELALSLTGIATSIGSIDTQALVSVANTLAEMAALGFDGAKNFLDKVQQVADAARGKTNIENLKIQIAEQQRIVDTLGPKYPGVQPGGTTTISKGGHTEEAAADIAKLSRAQNELATLTARVNSEVEKGTPLLRGLSTSADTAGNSALEASGKFKGIHGQFVDTTKAGEEAKKAIEGVTKALAQAQADTGNIKLGEKIKEALTGGGSVSSLQQQFQSNVADKIRAQFADAIEKGGQAAADKVDQIVSTTISGLAAKVNTDLKDKIDSVADQANFEALQVKLDEAYKQGNLSAVPGIIQQLAEATKQGTLKGLGDAVIQGNEQTKALADKLAQAEADAYKQKAAVQLEQATKDAFNNSVSFFSDLFNSAIDGSAQNFEDIFKDVVKRIAIGFASQIAANLAGSAFSGVSSAQGIGQAIATSLGFDGGGVKGIGELLSGPAAPLTASATALDLAASHLSGAAASLTGAAGTSSVGGGVQGLSAIAQFFGGQSATSGAADILTSMPGFEGYGAILNAGSSGGAAAGGAGLLGSIAPYAIAAGGVYGAYNLFTQQHGAVGGALQGAASGAAIGSIFGPPGIAIGAGLGGIAGLATSDLFDSHSQKYQEKLDREAFLNSLSDKFGGVSFANAGGGQSTLNAKNFNIDQSSDFGKQGASFGSTIAQLLNGGDGKLTTDLAGIFGNAIDEAKNFNEQLVNTQSALNKFGIDAKEAKSQLSDLFLDGKISLGEFGADLNNLNVISQNVFTGPDGIQQGLDIIGQTIEKSPRVALQALGDEFNTLQQKGLTSTTAIAQYFTNNMQPEVAAAFTALASLGVKSFDDIATAISQNPDLVFAIISAMQSLKTNIQETDTSAQNLRTTLGKDDSNAGAVFRTAKSNVDDLKGSLDGAISKAKTLIGLTRGDTGTNNNSGDQKLNGNAP